MITTSADWTAQIIDHTRRLEEYKETLRRLFPTLRSDLLDAHSLRDVDAIVLGLFLRCLPPGLSVLEVGTSFGVSTFHLASQPGVLRVLGVDPGLPGLSTPDDTSNIPGVKSDPPQEPRALDLARAALAEFAEEGAKIQLRTGEVGSVLTGPGDPPDDQAHPQPTASGLTADEPLLAFLNGAPARESVEEDLRAIFDASPRAVAVIDHCRGVEGPFVQARIASFLDGARDEYRFRLFADLTSGVATSNLGIVYPDANSAEVEGCLEELTHLFSDRLDPLWLASREQEMISVVNTYKVEAESLNTRNQELLAELQQVTGRNNELQKRTSQLEKRKSQLEERAAELKKEKNGLQKQASQLEKRVSGLEQRKTQLVERTAAIKEEKKALQGRSSRLEQRNSRLEERNSRLKEERLLLDSQLDDYRRSGRYKLADTVTRNVLRIPGAKALARRTRPKE
jgi:hypothetical protein